MAKRQAPKSAELAVAAMWQAFYAEHRAALASLFVEFQLYERLAGNDPHEALRHEGQRDVLLRIVQLIGLKPENAAADAWGDADILDRMMGPR